MDDTMIFIIVGSMFSCGACICFYLTMIVRSERDSDEMSSHNLRQNIRRRLSSGEIHPLDESRPPEETDSPV